MARSANGCTGLASVLKKPLLASEQLRSDVAKARRDGVRLRQPFMANMLERLVFIDEIAPLMRHWFEPNGER